MQKKKKHIAKRKVVQKKKVVLEPKETPEQRTARLARENERRGHPNAPESEEQNRQRELDEQAAKDEG